MIIGNTDTTILNANAIEDEEEDPYKDIKNPKQKKLHKLIDSILTKKIQLNA